MCVRDIDRESETWVQGQDDLFWGWIRRPGVHIIFDETETVYGGGEGRVDASMFVE